MKKITLLAASIFLFGSGVANAVEKTSFSYERKIAVDYRDAEPIVFIERGIEFFVFADGQFDFNTEPSKGSDMYYRRSRTSAVNKTHGAPSNFRNKNHGVKIEHDKSGKVRRIGNVFVNYDSNDRIKRVGSVYMSYNRYALEKVGGLKIIYNRRGQIVDITGSVKGGKEYQYGQGNNGNYDYEYDNNQNGNNQDDYYRSTAPKVKKEGTRVVGSVDIRIEKRL
jgi:hypothetical protein